MTIIDLKQEKPVLTGRGSVGEKLQLYGLVGFLGAGKTTTLQQILLYCRQQNLRPGLLINDFGEVNIDALILRETGLSLEELTGGCICCGTSFELMAAAVYMSKNPEIDLLLLEASGIAEPDQLLDQLSDPMLWSLCRVGGLISVVDCSRWEMLSPLLPVVKRGVQFADVLLVNKQDEVSPAELAKIEQELEDLNPAAPQFKAVRGIPEDGFEPVFRSLQDSSLFRAVPARRKDRTIHESFHSLTIPVDKPLKRADLEAFVKELPENIYRAKGLVQIEGETLPILFQYVGGVTGAGSLELKPYQVTPDRPADFQAVFIGQNLDKEAISQRFLEII
jgi:G3E family GTPase